MVIFWVLEFSEEKFSYKNDHSANKVEWSSPHVSGGRRTISSARARVYDSMAEEWPPQGTADSTPPTVVS